MDASPQPPGSSAVPSAGLEQIAALVEAYGRMLGSMDPDALVPAVLDLSRQFLVADAYAIWRCDQKSDNWCIHASSGISEHFATNTARISSPRTADSAFAYLQAPIPVEDVLALPDDSLLAQRRRWYESEGIRSLLIVPLRLHGRSLATIVYYYRSPRSFAPAELQAAAAYANLASSALTSAELHVAEQAARHQAEDARHEAELLYQAGQLLSRMLDPDEIYDTVRSLIADNMACDSLIVSSFDSDTETISCSYAWVEGSRLDPRDLPPVRLAPEGRGMQSEVIRTGKPHLISNVVERVKTNQTTYHVHADGAVLPQPDPKQPRSQSMMMVPIVLEKRVLGVAQIQSHQPDSYTERDLRLLEAMVLQMAAAARNAFLYQRAQAEIAQRAQAEQKLERHVAEIQSLNERLKRAMTETHHRVKNNLQIMAAMVDMQVLEGTDTIPATELARLGTHIRTLAVIHELLTNRSDPDSRSEMISARDILQKLLPHLQNTGGTKELRFRLDDALLTSRQGTSLALVTNELVSNAVKYGQSAVDVVFRTDGELVRLVVEDDGPGFEDGFEALRAANTGLELVENLSRWDLGGAARYENRDAGGARVVVEFPAVAIAP